MTTTMMIRFSFVLVAALCLLFAPGMHGFSHGQMTVRIRNADSRLYSTAAPGQRTERRVRNDEDLLGNPEQNAEDAIREKGPLEWLEDDLELSREDTDPFHILVLKETFGKPKITVEYVAQNLEYVLGMPYAEGLESAQGCLFNGMSCVGVWPRKECIRLGQQLQLRDLVVRVVPYCKGGEGGWQAKDASDVGDASHYIE